MSIIKSLALTNGDLVIENNEFQMVNGNELLRQKVQDVIATNKGEWFMDWEQGIDFSNLTGKKVDEDIVRAEIEEGLQQVDEDLTISQFSMEITGRTLKVTFTAIKEEDNTEIVLSTEY